MPVTQFSVGRVIGRGFGIFLGNFGRFLPVILATSIPLVVVLVLFPSQQAGSDSSGDVSFDVNFALDNASDIIGFLVSTVTYCWLSAGVTFGVVSTLRGSNPGGVEVLVRSLRSVPRLILLVLVLWLLSALLMIPLILLALIPVVGFFIGLGLCFWLLIMIWLSVPAVVVESIGPFAALKRSHFLTKGHRWRVAAILLILFVLMMIAVIGLMLVLLAVGTAVDISSSNTIAGAIIFAVIQSMLMGLGASMTAVAYHDLRVEKEGVGTEQIAQVFD